MKNFLLLFLFLLLCTSAFSQQKWSQDPRMMSIVGDGKTSTEPNYESMNYVNPNTKMHVVNTIDGVAIVFPNKRVHPSPYTQSEVPITSHATNKNFMYGSCNWFKPPSFFSEGCYVTTDGGENWFGSDTTNAAPLTDHVGDPAPAIDLNNRMYISYLQMNGGGGIYVSNSTNYGQTWANATLVTAASSDKNHTVTINNPSSPYNGNTIVSWSNFAVSNPNIQVSVTSNNGTTWSAPITVQTPPSGVYAQGVNGVQGPNGEVYLVWQSPMAGSPFTGKYCGFAKSTNGGFSWTANNNIYTCNGARGNIFASGIRINDFPIMGCDLSSGPRRGWLYVVTNEKNLAPAGSDPDIVMHRSTDGGTTWSPGIRVNQDALNNGKYQYMPSLVVGTDGSVNVVYYDNRNVTGDSVQVYVSRSLDGGVTFSDILVSDHAFKPAPISGLAGGYQGDYIGITEGPGASMFPYWADNKSGIYQAWTAKMMFGPTIVHTALPNTENLAGPYKVGANISSSVGVNTSQVWLYWTRGTSFDSLLMTNVAGDSFAGNIPGNGSTGTYKYYIYAKDNSGGYSTSPAGAPGTYYSFVAAPDNTPPTVNHTALSDQYRELWPATVTSTVTDNIGLDSVWVVYKLKFNGTQRQFKLGTVAGNNYSGVFNIDTSLIAVGDTIYYRIVARDASVAHNLGYFPSATGYNTFKFIGDSEFPVLTHTPLRNQAKLRWPAKVTATATDNMGIASVVVEWKINNGSIRSFNLTGAGSLYTGYFNADSSQINVGDSISYKVIATDRSTSHNVTTVPASGYFVFHIIQTKGVVLVVNDDITLANRMNSEKGPQQVSDAPLGASSTLFNATLTTAGYMVDSASFASVDPATFVNYDIVILSAGLNTNLMFNDAAKRLAYSDYSRNGGRTWVEGGEVGWKYRQTSEVDADFRMTVLNDSTWISDVSSGMITIKDPSHPIFNYPNVLTGAPWSLTGTGWGNRDAMYLLRGKSGVRKVACWDTYPDTASLIIRFAGSDPSDIRNVTYHFAVGTMTDQVVAAKLIENTAEALMSGNPTPVELSSFTADVNNGTVNLRWNTATELNNSGFEIQRTSNYLNYEKIGFVKGQGTTTSQNSYSFTDSKLENGTYAYRLKQIDYDGKFKYSNAIEVNVTNPITYTLEQNYPNPFNPSTVIKYSVPQDGLVSLQVFNVLGQKVITLVNQNMKAGKYEVSFNASNMASGIYFYRLDSGKFTSVKKMMLVK